MKRNMIYIQDRIENKLDIDKIEWDFHKDLLQCIRNRKFDYTTYYAVLQAFNKKIRSKFRFLKFANDVKIISKLRKYLDKFEYYEDTRTSYYEYKYRLKGHIEVFVEFGCTTYIIILDKIIKDGPYTWY